jgi:spore coat protein U-like protein
MKIVKASLVAAIALVGSSAAVAQTVGTSINAPFTVSTSVLAFCKVSAQNIVIAPITPGDTTATGDKSSTGGVSVNCTNQTAYTLTVEDTLDLVNATSNYEIPTNLALNVTTGTGAGFGEGTVKSHVVTATIPQAAYENAVAGAYTANTTVTLTY